MKFLLIVMLMAASMSASAGRTDDMCLLAKAETHGLRCKVIHYGDGSASTLLIKRYASATDSEEAKARYRLTQEQIIETHFRNGGGSLKIRFIGKDGAWYEKPCNKGKGTYKPYCYDAVRVDDSKD